LALRKQHLFYQNYGREWRDAEARPPGRLTVWVPFRALTMLVASKKDIQTATKNPIHKSQEVVFWKN